jgi:hypothetical protein
VASIIISSMSGIKKCLKRNLGMFMLFFGIAMIFIISPILTYFYGKLVLFLGLWLWSLAETAGDIMTFIQ